MSGLPNPRLRAAYIAAIVAGVLGSVLVFAFVDVPDDSATAMAVLIGALARELTAIGGWFLGRRDEDS